MLSIYFIFSCTSVFCLNYYNSNQIGGYSLFLKKKKIHGPQNVNSAMQKSNSKYLVSEYHKTDVVLVSKDKQPAGDKNWAKVRQGLNGQRRLS